MKRWAIQRRGIGWMALGTLAVAFVVRLVWILRVQSPHAAVYSDMGGYVHRAEELLGLAPTVDPRMLAFYPWGAHALFAAEFAVFGRHSIVGIAVVHALVSAIPAACVVFCAARVCRTRVAVAFAGAIAALWHPQITYAAFFMSELWFTAAIAVATWLYARYAEHRAGALGCGCALAVAFVVRPQVILTCAFAASMLVPLALRSRARRRLTSALPRLALVLLPLALAVAGSAIRLERLTGHYGLISENESITRLFGVTTVGRVEATWGAPTGERMSAWYSPLTRHPLREENIVRFEGYIGDSRILGEIRDRRLRSMSTLDRVRLARRNLESLVLHTYPNPEEDFATDPRRAALQRLFRHAVIGLLPFAIVGLWVASRRVIGVILVAHAATILVVGLLYASEARYRVPYDPFLILAAVVGAESAALWLGKLLRRRAFHRPSAPPAAGSKSARHKLAKFG